MNSFSDESATLKCSACVPVALVMSGVRSSIIHSELIKNYSFRKEEHNLLDIVCTLLYFDGVSPILSLCCPSAVAVFKDKTVIPSTAHYIIRKQEIKQSLAHFLIHPHLTIITCEMIIYSIVHIIKPQNETHLF